jgi:hypothetical protein
MRSQAEVDHNFCFFLKHALGSIVDRRRETVYNLTDSPSKSNDLTKKGILSSILNKFCLPPDDDQTTTPDDK